MHVDIFFNNFVKPHYNYWHTVYCPLLLIGASTLPTL